jgi:tetratricopeptide (TPR) repeat protein
LAPTGTRIVKSSERIEKLIAKQDWPRARALILAKLKKRPDSHWHIARLALTHYEERDYNKARELAIEGLNLNSQCPLLCWEYAGSCSMLDKNKDAIAVYEWLIERGVDELAYGECGEGRRWARSLVTDCYFRTALCYEATGNRRKARAAIKRHLQERGPGCRSIYSIADARKIAKRLGLKAA